MRYHTFTSLAFLLATLCPTATSQAVAEYGLGAGRAATTTAPAGKIANGISDTLSKVAGADSGAAAPGSSSPSLERRSTTAHTSRGRTQAKQPAKPVETKAAAAVSAAPTAAAPAYENLGQIKAGIDYDELVRRFGPPSMSVASGPGTSTLWYSGAGGNCQVEVEDGKVIAPKRTSSQ